MDEYYSRLTLQQVEEERQKEKEQRRVEEERKKSGKEGEGRRDRDRDRRNRRVHRKRFPRASNHCLRYFEKKKVFSFYSGKSNDEVETCWNEFTNINKNTLFG